MSRQTPIQGIGVGLREQHYAHFLTQKPKTVTWLELLSDNYLFSFGILRDKVLKIRQDYPMVLHGVGMNLGSYNYPDLHYLGALKQFADLLEVNWISDHLCWTAIDGLYSHELLPLPFTQEALALVIRNIEYVQDYLQYPLLIENVSSYLQLSPADFTEAEFLAEVATRTGCGILLDVNNVFVCAKNHGFNAEDYLLAIPTTAVRQFHLGGYVSEGDLLIDTHSTAVSTPVWQLFQKALTRFGKVPTNIEWDNAIPQWSTLAAQIELAKKYYE